MIKQRRGLWICICSLIPGAGELCMGFRKQGVSIMAFFWGVIAIAAALDMSYLIMALPIIWFYSFFNVNNLKTLSEEEFYSLEDDYLFHLDRIVDDKMGIKKQYRNIVATILIIIGGVMLIKNFMHMVYLYLPNYIAYTINGVLGFIPQLVVAVGIILLGIYLINGKKKELNQMEENETGYAETETGYAETETGFAETETRVAATENEFVKTELNTGETGKTNKNGNGGDENAENGSESQNEN